MHRRTNTLRGPDGWGPEGWVAQNFALFSLSRHNFLSWPEGGTPKGRLPLPKFRVLWVFGVSAFGFRKFGQNTKTLKLAKVGLAKVAQDRKDRVGHQAKASGALPDRSNKQRKRRPEDKLWLTDCFVLQGSFVGCWQ